MKKRGLKVVLMLLNSILLYCVIVVIVDRLLRSYCIVMMCLIVMVWLI